MKPLLLMTVIAMTAGAQQFKINLDHLAAKASEAVDLSLNGATLQFAAKFLDSNDPDEAQARKLLSGIEGIYIKSYQFKKDNEWTPADLDAVHQQLRAPEWTRIISHRSEDKENSEIFVRYQDKKVTGVAIVAVDPHEFTVVNIVGPIDIDSLAGLSGHFGVPKLRLPPRKGDRKMEDPF